MNNNLYDLSPYFFLMLDRFAQSLVKDPTMTEDEKTKSLSDADAQAIRWSRGDLTGHPQHLLTPEVKWAMAITWDIIDLKEYEKQLDGEIK